MKVWYLIPMALVSSALVFWLRTINPWSDRTLTPDKLFAKIRQDRFAGMEDYLDQGPLPSEDFWGKIGGFRGVYDRFCEMITLVRILQLQVHAGRVSPTEANRAWRQARLQLWFSAWVPIECFFAVTIHTPHVAAMCALRCHYELTVSTVTLCGTSESQVSASKLYGIL
jgi:hypothetical protein